MKRKLISAGRHRRLAGAAALAPAPAFAQNAEIEALKAAARRALRRRSSARESRRRRPRRPSTRRRPRPTRPPTSWRRTRRALSVRRVTCATATKTFDVQYVDRNRNRDRIRARFNANFRVNDTITGAARHRRPAATIRARATRRSTDQNSRKHVRSRSRPTSPGRRTRAGRSRPASSATRGRAPARCSTTTT